MSIIHPTNNGTTGIFGGAGGAYTITIPAGAGYPTGAGGTGYSYPTSAGGGSGGFFPSHISSTFGYENTSLLSYVNSKPCPRTKKFMESKSVFVSDMQIMNNSVMHFHFLVWESRYGQQYNDYGVIMRDNTEMYIAFGSEKSRDQLQNWYKNYKKLFFKSDHIGALPGPMPGEMKGHYVEDADTTEYDPMVLANVSQKQFDNWVWIVENCYHPVIRLTDGWLFENTAEAIHFKMR